jgi:type VI secretion system protein ImpA
MNQLPRERSTMSHGTPLVPLLREDSDGDDAWFGAVFDRLLAPLDADLPCGPPARHDAVVTEIRLLREEDDPSLPMGQWERPLKQADWPSIERHCIDLLGARSKDLQTVVWLAEAWMRQHGFAGLRQGLALLDALLQRYWTALHPLVEDDGDCDARLAPLEWLNETLSTGIRVHAPLFVVEHCRPPQLSLADWERLSAQDMAQDMAQGSDGAAPGQLITGDLAATLAAVRDSLGYLEAIIDFLQQRLQEQAPRLLKLENVLKTAHRVLLQVQAGQPSAVLALVGAAEDTGRSDGTVPPAAPDGALESGLQDGSAGVLAVAVAGNAAPVLAAGWRDRNEAYATLEAVSDYLARLEPHSPTPFLLRRAVRWGRMPLPEVLAEVLREEGDLNRLLNVLGLQSGH